MFSKSRLLQRRQKASIWGTGLTLFHMQIQLDAPAVDNFEYFLAGNVSFTNNVFKRHLFQMHKKMCLHLGKGYHDIRCRGCNALSSVNKEGKHDNRCPFITCHPTSNQTGEFASNFHKHVWRVNPFPHTTNLKQMTLKMAGQKYENPLWMIVLIINRIISFAVAKGESAHSILKSHLLQRCQKPSVCGKELKEVVIEDKILLVKSSNSLKHLVTFSFFITEWGVIKNLYP